MTWKRDLRDCSNQLFRQKDCIYRTLNASRCQYNCSNHCIVKKIASVVLLTFKYVFVVRFYFLSMSMFSDWCMSFSEIFFFFLVLTFSESETTCLIVSNLESVADLTYLWKISTKFQRWYSRWIMHALQTNFVMNCQSFCVNIRDFLN